MDRQGECISMVPPPGRQGTIIFLKQWRVIGSKVNVILGHAWKTCGLDISKATWWIVIKLNGQELVAHGRRHTEWRFASSSQPFIHIFCNSHLQLCKIFNMYFLILTIFGHIVNVANTVRYVPTHKTWSQFSTNLWANIGFQHILLSVSHFESVLDQKLTSSSPTTKDSWCKTKLKYLDWLLIYFGTRQTDKQTHKKNRHRQKHYPCQKDGR